MKRRKAHTEQLDSLVAKAGTGDPEAFEQIVRRFQDMACGYAYSILGDFQLAEDAAQEAFIDAYCKLADLRQPKAFPGWFRRIVFKHCDRITRSCSVLTCSLETAGEVPAQDMTPGEAITGSELKHSILAAVQALPEPERLATTLYYINGYTQKEVAEFMEQPLGTVKHRLHKARNRLKERMTAMVEETLKDNAPDEQFARRVRQAIRVYTAQGPTDGHIDSQWHQARWQQTSELLGAGEEGFRIDVALSKSSQARARAEAALNFGLRMDARGKAHLLRLMKDSNRKVRKYAVRQFARLIHPEGHETPLGCPPTQSAGQLPSGVENLVPMVADPAVNARLAAVWALGAYIQLGNADIERAVNSVLSDPKHKVQHAAARILGVTCPGCGAAQEKKVS